MKTAELKALLAGATETHSFEKCRCGHPACSQYIMSTQRSSGFDLGDARLYAAAPDLAAEVIRLREGLAALAGDFLPSDYVSRHCRAIMGETL